MSIPDMEQLRHRIDVLTADMPDDLTRTELVTFALAVTVQGIALALEMFPPELVNDPAARRLVVADLTETAVSLMAGMETR